jgi:hypothetical protein
MEPLGIPLPPLTPESPPLAPKITAPPVRPKPPPAPGPIVEPAPIPVPAPAPPGPSVPEAVPDLGKMSGLIVLLGLLALLVALTEMLNWAFKVALYPFTRGRAAPQFTPKTLGQGISSTLGNWEAKIDADIGLSFHKLAEMVDRGVADVGLVTKLVQTLAARLVALEGTSPRVAHAAQAAAAAAAAAQTTATHASAAAATTAAHSGRVEGGLQGQIDALTHHVTHLIEPELDTLRSAIPALEHGASTAWDEIVKHERLLGEAAMAAAVAAGLSRIGAGWVACEANQLLGQATCRRGPNAVKNLLEGLIDIAVILDLCQIVGLLVDVAESQAVTDVLTTLTSGIQELIQCRGIALAKPLPRGLYAQPGVLTGYAQPGVLV